MLGDHISHLIIVDLLPEIKGLCPGVEAQILKGLMLYISQ